ncbi:hypothetical protein AB1484_29900 [Parafrankia sp. FMc6]|uniref:hypothetical protein n=1 Tax=Parafrankia soli TaxID=2599596 RepID=UPI0034D777FF
MRLPLLTSRFEIGRGAGMQPPSPGKAVYYLGLGGLAVAEIIEWPVAAAIAAGTYVAQRSRPAASSSVQESQAEAARRES